MKALLLIPLLLLAAEAFGQESFNRYFEPRTMRYDYYHCGDQKSEDFFFDELKAEPHWAGSETSLIDDTGYGRQMFKIFDKESGKEIYSRSFNTLFNEWQDTEEALHIRKAMPESVVFPYPKKPVRIEFYSRNRKGIFEKKLSQDIDPSSYFIHRFSPQYATSEIIYKGAPKHHVDIVLIPEGYTAGEKEKFTEACHNFAKEFFSFSPYKELENNFNIWAVWAPSKDSGVTIPGEHIWRNTVTDARFYTFDSERYQMIEDFQRLRDIAAHVPYDHIYVLSNTQKYGGGGIYNSFGISAAHNPGNTGKIYVHEFGHVLLGLGDEYIGTVSYNDMYPLNVEPWEENLTTLKGLDKKDWKQLIKPNTPIPTPATKEYANEVGVFEGGGYANKGIYRPCQTCLMKEFSTDRFCPVCTSAIKKHVKWLCQ